MARKKRPQVIRWGRLYVHVADYIYTVALYNKGGWVMLGERWDA